MSQLAFLREEIEYLRDFVHHQRVAANRHEMQPSQLRYAEGVERETRIFSASMPKTPTSRSLLF